MQKFLHKNGLRRSNVNTVLISVEMLSIIIEQSVLHRISIELDKTDYSNLNDGAPSD